LPLSPETFAAAVDELVTDLAVPVAAWVPPELAAPEAIRAVASSGGRVPVLPSGFETEPGAEVG